MNSRRGLKRIPLPPAMTRLEWGIIVAVSGPILLALRRPFAIDEYLYLHWASQASHGVFAGIDYFATHFSFLQFVYAPWFFLSVAMPTVVPPEDIALIVRIVSALMATWTMYWLIGRRSVQAFAGSAWLCASFGSISGRILEIRPDNVSMFFIAASIRSLGSHPWLTGALVACAVLSSEKSLIVIPGILAWMVFSGHVSIKGLAKVALYASGTIFLIMILACRGQPDGLAHQAVEWFQFARLHESGSHWGPDQYLMPLRQVAWQLGILVTIWIVNISIHRSFDLVDTLALSGSVVYFSQHAPYGYSLNWFLVPLIASTGRKLSQMADRTHRRNPLLACLLIIACAVTIVTEDASVFSTQMSVLTMVRRNSSDRDCIYDNSAGAFFRDHAHDKFLQTDQMMRRVWGDRLVQEIPETIRQRGCMIMLVDIRNADLPAPLRDHLSTQFMPVSPWFYFYRDRVDPGTREFFAPKSGIYQVLSPSGSGKRLFLTRGVHVMEPGIDELMWSPGTSGWEPWAGPMDIGSFSRI